MERIDPELVEILVCPDTKENVELAPVELIKKINLAIKEQQIRNLEDQPVEEPLQDGLIRDDGVIIYPVRDCIPVMLIGEGIPMKQFD
tara:strand:- start:533 stop:796 length:264 start_codon:yes stop_codon:yes gene_type:complete